MGYECAVGTCHNKFSALQPESGWLEYCWGWVCPDHDHECGPGCYGMADAGCCADHPDCAYDSLADAGLSAAALTAVASRRAAFEGKTTISVS